MLKAKKKTNEEGMTGFEIKVIGQANDVVEEWAELTTQLINQFRENDEDDDTFEFFDGIYEVAKLKSISQKDLSDKETAEQTLKGIEALVKKLMGKLGED